MRALGVPFAAVAVIAAPAHAADELKFGPAPAWVVPQAIPSEASKSKQAPVALLLNDSQIRLDRGKVTSFTNLAIKVQTAEGLQAGNVAFAWQPSTDTVTVNRLHLIRDGKVIDVLKAGQTFTVARRETNMEAAVLDGTLTANIQPEGLQVGDVIDLAVTTERVDPVMKGHVETAYGGWDGVTIEKAHARISWPDELGLSTRQTAELPKAKRSTKDGWNILELSAEGLEPLLLPKGAPLRFQIGRAGEATDFRSWSDLADLMAPLYRQAAVVPKSGPLRDELEKIRQTASTDKERAEKALQLVQDRVRYVALAMGMGGYVPASAEETWSRRFGDCKAKTSLLVALLRELGIESDVVAVHSRIGDALPQLLPMVSYFDHVIARAKIGGKTYWLDGTRTGDGDLDRIPAGNFKWGLPLVAKAELVPIVPKPLAEPETHIAVQIDAGKGVFAALPIKAELTLRGDAARGLNAAYANLSAAQATEGMREYWKDRYDYVEVQSMTSNFDKGRQELRWSMTGEALLDWNNYNWFYVPESTIAYEPSFERAAGPYRDAPFSVAYPSWETVNVTVRLPDGFAAGRQKMPQPISETLAGVEYRRDVQLNGSDFVVRTGEKSIVMEIPYEDAIAAKPRLKALYEEDVHLRVPTGYRLSDADLAGLAARKPASASDLVWRGNIYLDSAKYDEAIADFTEANRLDPTNKWALPNRAMARAWKGDSAEAERDLAAAEAIDPGNYVVLRVRGLLAERKQDFKAAADHFTKSLETDPGNSFALSHRALAYMNLEKFEEAIADLNAILAREPQNLQALTQRAHAYRATGKNDEAFADSEAAVKAGRAPPELRLMRANTLRGQGKHDLALNEAELLIKENPESGWALVAAARIFSAEGRRDKAMATFDAALAVDREAYVYVNRAQVRPRDDAAARLADLDEALKLEPENGAALAMKARLLFQQGRPEEAIPLFERASKVNPDDRLDLLRGRAVALHKSGKADEAKKAFDEIRSQSSDAGDFNALCWDKATAGLFLDSALEDCRKALELDPERASYIDSLGMALLRLGRLDDAVEAYDRAIAKAPMAASYMGRAIAHAQKGDLARAEADRAQAVKLYSDIETEFADYGLTVADAQKSLVER